MGLLDLLGSASGDAAVQVIAFAQDRHKVLADAIANIDTPGYRSRDLDKQAFDAAIKDAIERAHDTNPSTARLDLPDIETLDRHASTRNEAAAQLRNLVFHDDNDRSIEKLIVELNKNAGRHAQAVTLLRKQVQLLQSVLAEQV